MKRHAMAACLLTAALSVCAQTQEQDSLRVINLQEVEVISTRATSSTPVAFTNIGKEQLKKQNFGQDLPYLLSMTPSAITTSDAGAGVGYTTLRVRGTDGTRINVTANGIPINDAESHTVFWVNLPDFASSVKDMQVQRGAGTSTNGAGAFGASINMQTGDFSMKPYAEFNGSYGSFLTLVKKGRTDQNRNHLIKLVPQNVKWYPNLNILPLQISMHQNQNQYFP